MTVRSIARNCGIFLGIVMLVSGVLAWRTPELRWRLRVLALVAAGNVPDLGLRDAVRMLRPNSGYWLKGLTDTHSAYATIVNPDSSPQDIKAGARLFRSNCAACHGADARGHERAPALVGRHLLHGDSDWALYRTIRNGIGGSAMPAHSWSDARIWRTIAYLRSLDATNRSSSTTPALSARIDVPYAEIAATDEPGKDWLTYSGSYSGMRHSTLAQISPETVSRLAPRWMFQISGEGDPLEVSPIVREGVMFVAVPGRVVALDARTGKTIWDFNYAVPPDVRLCCADATRGLAILGDRLFFGTADARLVALSARTGRLLWSVPVTKDYREGYSITAAPLAFRDLVVTGISGGDYPIRGFIAAFDAATGEERWRFHTIPGPGEPGHESWANDSWQDGGGATWMTGSYDPRSDVLYWGVGNAAPDFDATTRKGDDLYTDSVVALRGTTGRLLWHFQFSPGDEHDWDSSQVPVIVNRPQATVPQELLWPNRNGFFYAFDRNTGRFLLGTPFVRQTWASRLSELGRPMEVAAAAPATKGTLVYPGVPGATNWWPPSYDPDLDLLFVPALDRGGVFIRGPDTSPSAGELYACGATSSVPGLESHADVLAIRPGDGSIAWDHRAVTTTGDIHPAGLLSTRGGLVFASDNDLFYALDSRSGALLWSFPSGAQIAAAPVTYGVDGIQYVAIAAGRVVISFALTGVGASHVDLAKVSSP